jgi:succinate dehydrogenase hydrophobic anchor subunit
MSSITLIAGQITYRTLRSPLIRTAIAFLFAVPAAVAGYHAALGLAHIGMSPEGWRHAVAVTGAIVVAATASARMARFRTGHCRRRDIA